MRAYDFFDVHEETKTNNEQLLNIIKSVDFVFVFVFFGSKFDENNVFISYLKYLSVFRINTFLFLHKSSLKKIITLNIFEIYAISKIVRRK